LLISASLHYYIFASFTAIMLLIATYTDLKRREIPNELVVAGMVFGLTLWGLTTGLSGLGSSFLGFITGFVLFLILAVTGGMEMGDVKLMGALGALTGWPVIISAVIHVVISGFVFAILWVIIEGNLLRTLKNLKIMMVSWILPKRKRVTLDKLETSTLPYGVAIAMGGIWTIIAIKVPQIDMMLRLL
jgi:prepilin peptidase CpaA